MALHSLSDCDNWTDELYLYKVEFAITKEISEVVLKIGASDTISEFSERVSDFLKIKEYGTGLQTIYIGIICVGPEFDFFFKIRKPKYYKDKTIIQDGRPYRLVNTFTYDIKLNYEQVITASKDELHQMLSDEVIKSLSNFEKIKNFDIVKFESELTEFLTIKDKYIL